MNTASSFGDQYQEIVIEMVDNGFSESEILKSLEENYSVTISRRTLSRRKEDWGLTNHAAQQIHSLEETITKHFDSVKPDSKEAAGEQYRPSARPMHLSGQTEADSRAGKGDMGGMIGKRDGIFPSFALHGNRNKMGLDSLEGTTGLGDQLMGLGGSRALNGLGDSAMSQGRPRGTDGYEDSMAANDPSVVKSHNLEQHTGKGS
ncbi:hypothetical protein PGTUg99_011658 [Puccinia graminis f. sp. tritici]|uniref:Clr5 domain-containing protein n=1 Tax=Puccinia graminis f. sp. tritici TaxID=56615 RepID=A0A5B0M4B2_PUCGR|nr:hypothetical protein PGTUg99_011658 [Puccinia graminis f. sp. tritici]